MDTLSRQCSLASAWPRFVRVASVVCTWVLANGLPASPQQWAAMIGAMLGASLTGADSTPKK